MSQFLDDDNNATALATAIPRVFFENSQAKNTFKPCTVKMTLTLYHTTNF